MKNPILYVDLCMFDTKVCHTIIPNINVNYSPNDIVDIHVNNKICDECDDKSIFVGSAEILSVHHIIFDDLCEFISDSYITQYYSNLFNKVYNNFSPFQIVTLIFYKL